MNFWEQFILSAVLGMVNTFLHPDPTTGGKAVIPVSVVHVLKQIRDSLIALNLDSAT